MWLPLMAKFSSFQTTVVNLAGSRASEDSRFRFRSVRPLDFHDYMNWSESLVIGSSTRYIIS